MVSNKGAQAMETETSDLITNSKSKPGSFLFRHSLGIPLKHIPGLYAMTA